jgi:hypothetical protein
VTVREIIARYAARVLGACAAILGALAAIAGRSAPAHPARTTDHAAQDAHVAAEKTAPPTRGATGLPLIRDTAADDVAAKDTAGAPPTARVADSAPTVVRRRRPFRPHC